jgi:hypothetical protein
MKSINSRNMAGLLGAIGILSLAYEVWRSDLFENVAPVLKFQFETGFWLVLMGVAALTMIAACITLRQSLIVASALLMIATATLTPLMIFLSLG